MHAITKFATIASLSISLLGSVFAADWQYVAVTLNADGINAYDIESVRHKDGNTLAWVVYINSNPKVQHDMIMALNEIDCEALRVKYLVSRYYLRGKVIKEMDNENYGHPTWRYIAPGTMGELTAQSVCKRTRSSIHFEGTLPSEITKWGKDIIAAEREITNRRSEF